MKKLLTIVMLGIATASQAWDDKENEIWLVGYIGGQLNDKWSITLAEEIHKNDGFNYNYRHTDFSTTWKFLPDWSITPAYRYATVSLSDEDISFSAWHLNLDNKLSFAGMDLKSRLRVITFDLNEVPNRTDLRPRFTLFPTQGWTRWNLKPFLEEEPMFNLDNNCNFYRNRISLGLKCVPIERVSLSTFLMQEIIRPSFSGEWTEGYNLGFVAGIKF